MERGHAQSREGYVQADDEGAVKAVDKSAINADGKGAVKGDDRSAIKPSDKGAVRADKRGAVKADKRGAVKADKRGAVKADKRGEVKPSDKGAVKAHYKGAVKADNRGAVKPSYKGAVKADKRTAVKADDRGAVKPSNKGAVKADDNGAVKANVKDAVKADDRGSVKPSDKGAVNADDRGAVEADDKGNKEVEGKKEASPRLSRGDTCRWLTSQDTGPVGWLPTAREGSMQPLHSWDSPSCTSVPPVVAKSMPVPSPSDVGVTSSGVSELGKEVEKMKNLLECKMGRMPGRALGKVLFGEVPSECALPRNKESTPTRLNSDEPVPPTSSVTEESGCEILQPLHTGTFGPSISFQLRGRESVSPSAVCPKTGRGPPQLQEPSPSPSLYLGVKSHVPRQLTRLTPSERQELIGQPSEPRQPSNLLPPGPDLAPPETPGVLRKRERMSSMPCTPCNTPSDPSPGMFTGDSVDPSASRDYRSPPPHSRLPPPSLMSPPFPPHQLRRHSEPRPSVTSSSLPALPWYSTQMELALPSQAQHHEPSYNVINCAYAFASQPALLAAMLEWLNLTPIEKEVADLARDLCREHFALQDLTRKEGPSTSVDDFYDPLPTSSTSSSSTSSESVSSSLVIAGSSSLTPWPLTPSVTDLLTARYSSGGNTPRYSSLCELTRDASTASISSSAFDTPESSPEVTYTTESSGTAHTSDTKTSLPEWLQEKLAESAAESMAALTGPVAHTHAAARLFLHVTYYAPLLQMLFKGYGKKPLQPRAKVIAFLVTLHLDDETFVPTLDTLLEVAPAQSLRMLRFLLQNFNPETLFKTATRIYDPQFIKLRVVEPLTKEDSLVEKLKAALEEKVMGPPPSVIHPPAPKCEVTRHCGPGPKPCQLYKPREPSKPRQPKEEKNVPQQKKKQPIPKGSRFKPSLETLRRPWLPEQARLARCGGDPPPSNRAQASRSVPPADQRTTKENEESKLPQISKKAERNKQPPSKAAAKDPGKDLVNNATKATGKDQGKDLVRDSMKAPAKDPGKDLVRDSMKAPAKDPGKDLVRDSMKAPAKDPGKDLVRDSMKAPAKDPGKDLVRDSMKAPAKDPGKDLVRDSMKAPAKDPGKDLVRDSMKAPAKDPGKDLVRDSMKALAKDPEKDPALEDPTDEPFRVPKETPRYMILAQPKVRKIPTPPPIPLPIPLRCNMPKLSAPKVPIRPTVTSVLREGCGFKKAEAEYTERLDAMMAGAPDYTRLQELQEKALREQRIQEQRAIEKKHLQGLLSHEEAALAKEAVVERQKQLAEKVRKEKEELERTLAEFRVEECKKIRASVEKAHQIEIAAKEKTQEVQRNKQETVQILMRESKERMERAMQERQEELEKRIQLIRKVRAFEAILKLQWKDEIDFTEFPGFGLLCEMSMEELKERKAILKIELEEERERKRQHVLETRERQKEMLRETEEYIRECRGSRMPEPRPGPSRSIPSSTFLSTESTSRISVEEQEVNDADPEVIEIRNLKEKLLKARKQRFCMKK